MTEIFVDADACPVKDEISRVAKRYGLKVIYVSNSRMRIPEEGTSELVVVEGKRDGADNWIVERVEKDNIVITADIPLAYRSIQCGARVIDPTGRILSSANIGQILATRDLMAELREAGAVVGGGPPPFQKKDRSRFLQSLDQMIQDVRRDRTS